MNLLLSLMFACGWPGVSPAASAPQDAAGLEAVFFAVHADQDMDRWYRIVAPSQPQFPTTSTVHPGEPFQLVLLVTGLGDRGDGTARATWSLGQTRADGEPGVDAVDLPLYEGRLQPSAYVLSTAIPTLAFDDEEPLGTTTLTATVHDEATGRSVSADCELELVPWSYDDIPALPEDHGWMAEFHTAPDPWVLPRWFLEGASLQADDRAHVAPVFSFFEILFAQNPWIVTHLVERFPQATAEQRVRIVTLLRRLADERAPELEAALDEEGVARVESLLDALDVPKPARDEAITEAIQLDLLWAEFMATGRYEPVRRIVSALVPHGEDEDASLEVVRKAAQWSLGSNMRQHPLVFDYCWAMVQRGWVSQDERVMLLAIMKKEFPDRIRIPSPDDAER